VKGRLVGRFGLLDSSSDGEPSVLLYCKNNTSDVSEIDLQLMSESETAARGGSVWWHTAYMTGIVLTMSSKQSLLGWRCPKE